MERARIDRVHQEIWSEYAPTARGKEDYFQDFDLDVEYLRNKRILEIGSGLNQFANELKDDNIDLVSFDPFYALSRKEREALYSKNGYEDGDEKLREHLDQLESVQKSSPLVAGRSEDMPFSDGSFDLVMSHFASPFYAEDPDKIKQFFRELKRILKKGGEARIYPFWIRVSSAEKNLALRDSLDALKSEGFSVENTDTGALVLKKIEHDTQGLV